MARPARRDAELLSLPACRRLLGKAGEGVSDDDLARLRDQFYGIALCVVPAYETSSSDTGEATTALDCLPADAREDVEERAAIIQFDAKLPRGLATRAAVAARMNVEHKGR